MDAQKRRAIVGQSPPHLAQNIMVCRIHGRHAPLRTQHDRDHPSGRGSAPPPVQAEGIDFDLKREGILHIYRNKAGFDHAGEVSKMLAKGGLPRRAVTPQEMKVIEPTLAGTYYGGYFTESDSTGDIHKFTAGLAAAAERLGVRTLYDQDVTAVKSDGQQVVITVAQQEAATCVHTFDGVVAAGAANVGGLRIQTS